jgi:HAD superfamily phosphatase (TIGR01668 family)
VLAPDLHVSRVRDIDLAWLADRGIRAVLVDVDDTLLPGDDQPMHDSDRQWLGTLQGSGFDLAILSNGTAQRVHTLGAQLGVPTFALAGKPFAFAFHRALAALQRKPHESAMVGDQLFTDVLGARWAGLTSVLVHPLTPGRHAHTRLLRRVERLILSGDNR